MASLAAIFAMGNPVALDAEGGGAGDSGVHFDGDESAGCGVEGELDVAAAGVDADFADDGDALVAHFLVFAVGEGHGWCDGYGVAGVDAEGVDVFRWSR